MLRFDNMSTLVTESAALRKCNLPSTPRWRAWIRKTLDPVEVGGGMVYETGSVRRLARKIGSFCAATAEHDEPLDPPTAAPQ